MAIGKGMYAMLLAGSLPWGFIPERRIADTRETSEVRVALSAAHREETDRIVCMAVSARWKRVQGVDTRGLAPGFRQGNRGGGQPGFARPTATRYNHSTPKEQYLE